MTYDSRPDTWEHIGKVRNRIESVIRNLHARSDQHDRSKLESPERECFDEFTPKLDDENVAFAWVAPADALGATPIVA